LVESPERKAKSALSVVVVTEMRAFPIFQPDIHGKRYCAGDKGCDKEEDEHARTNLRPYCLPISPSQ
jgi:hypothetical protein